MSNTIYKQDKSSKNTVFKFARICSYKIKTVRNHGQWPDPNAHRVSDESDQNKSKKTKTN